MDKSTLDIHPLIGGNIYLDNDNSNQRELKPRTKTLTGKGSHIITEKDAQ